MHQPPRGLRAPAAMRFMRKPWQQSRPALWQGRAQLCSQHLYCPAHPAAAGAATQPFTDAATAVQGALGAVGTALGLG